MKTIKAITAALLLAVSMTAQADRTVVAKAKNGSTDKMQLSSRIVLDLTKESPVLRYNSGTTIYNPENTEIVLQMEDMTDAIKEGSITTACMPFFSNLSYRYSASASRRQPCFIEAWRQSRKFI